MPNMPNGAPIWSTAGHVWHNVPISPISAKQPKGPAPAVPPTGTNADKSHATLNGNAARDTARSTAKHGIDLFRADGRYGEILEIMNELRVFDTDHELSLPQLVVCGEQSAGKSSVLEAISGIPFPRKGSQCTRFVTQYDTS